MALADYDSLVRTLVRDDSGKIVNQNRDDAIQLAALRYSVDRPRVLTVDIAANGTTLLDVPAGWQDDVSRLVELEHPIGEAPPSLLSAEGWRVYKTPLATKIQLDDAIASGANLRVRFTAKHLLDAGSDTIPAHDREAVAAYAAALLLDQLASLYAGDRISTIASDSVDHQAKTRDYADRARSLRKRYFDHLGIDVKRNAAAGTVVNLDPADSLGNRTRLTHPVQHR